MLKTAEIRNKFIKYFEDKAHKHLAGSSLIPHNDPSVLLTTAGMLQFKPIMFGYEPPTHKRATTHQKCCRTSDLENVGQTPRHHTFFEMLGNFSFGDYYKKEVIPWAWNFLTKELGISEEKLTVSVHYSDQEAWDIWHKDIGLSENKIVKLGDEDNFWSAGETGPCGPCSEIYYDMGVEFSNGDPNEKAGDEGDRFLEIWNLVFMELNKKEDGTFEPLPAKNIDTGMGLERIASVLQNVPNNFEIDSIKPILDKIGEISAKKYGENNNTDTQFKIIADHARAMTYLISDGVFPGNVGREYVLRRIIRRAVRYGRLLEIEGNFLAEIVKLVIDIGKDAYPEINEKGALILKTVINEEEQFNKTLSKGMKLLNQEINQIKNDKSKVISGETAFELYDTYGFPVELTVEIAEENNLSVNLETYKIEMEKQVKRAREAHQAQSLDSNASDMNLTELAKTNFTGYTNLESIGKVLESSFNSEKDELVFVLDNTAAYAESGGQVSDNGYALINEKKYELLNIQKVDDCFVHQISTKENIVKKDDQVKIVIDEEARNHTARHHSATHLLHKALKDVLGEHVKQAGSLVNKDFTRFDFTHHSSVTKEELEKLEIIVNQNILNNVAVDSEVMSIDKARESGAVAMFGEKYGDEVRVITMGKHSKEFCGGTHVKRTGDIGSFKIISEEAVSSGTRRIIAIAGLSSYKYAKQESNIVHNLVNKFKVPSNKIIDRVDKMQNTINDLEKELKDLKQANALSQVKNLVNNFKETNGIKYLAEQLDIPDAKSLKTAASDLLNRVDSGVVTLAANISGKANLIIAVSDDLVKKGIKAGNLIKKIAPITGSRGGGKPQMAQAGGGENTDKISEALSLLEKELNN